MISGAQALVNALKREGVKVCFGYPGVAITPFYNALYDTEEIRHILVRTEQNAGHAANGYARVTGRPGVCITTSGPGATNLITALATAYADSIPMIAITGQVSSDLLGHDVFQEVDITGAAEAFVKYSYLVKEVSDIPRIMKEAFYIANSGRKGPVLIDVPIDIQNNMFEEYEPGEVSIRGYKPTTAGNPVQIAKVQKALEKAKYPLICVGGGVVLAQAEEEVRRYCEKTGIPVVSTIMGIGVMPKYHPLYFGMLGSNGKPYANRAVEESDVLVIVGARVADRSITVPNSDEKDITIIHIDIDSAEIGKNMGATVPLVGDAKYIFRELYDMAAKGSHDEWIAKLQKIKTTCVDPRVFHNEFVNPCEFVQTLSDMMDEDGVYVADVGQNQMWSADNYIMKKGKFMTTGGLGTMGYSIPAAMGAKLADPSRQVVAVCGDGSFQMNLMELATIQQHDIPVKVVILKNGYLGLVREYQHNIYDDHYMAVKLDGSPDFEKIAEAYGLPYYYVEQNKDVEATVEEFLKTEGSALMVCRVYEYDQVKG